MHFGNLVAPVITSYSIHYTKLYDKTAWENNASLIIMGCSKRYQFERLLLGRTASEVVNRSHCDVLFLPEHSEIRFNNILIGLSDTENNEKAVRRGFDIASSYGGKVHGIHSIFLPADRSLRYGVASDAERKASRITSYNVCYTKLLRFEGKARQLKVRDH